MNDSYFSSARDREVKDYWTKDGAFFVHYGKKYGVAPDGQTVSLGLVSGATQTTPEQKNSVTKIATKGIAPVVMSQPQETGILLQRGRPRKPKGEPVSRMTEWRRAKEAQGVLL